MSGKYAIVRNGSEVIAKYGRMSKQEIIEKTASDVDIEWSDDPNYVSDIDVTNPLNIH